MSQVEDQYESLSQSLSQTSISQPDKNTISDGSKNVETEKNIENRESENDQNADSRKMLNILILRYNVKL